MIYGKVLTIKSHKVWYRIDNKVLYGSLLGSETGTEPDTKEAFAVRRRGYEYPDRTTGHDLSRLQRRRCEGNVQDPPVQEESRRLLGTDVESCSTMHVVLRRTQDIEQAIRNEDKQADGRAAQLTRKGR